MQIRGLFKVDMWSRWLLWLCASFVYKTVHRVDVIGTRLDHSLHFASILHSTSVGIFRREPLRDPDKRCPGSSIHPFIIHRNAHGESDRHSTKMLNIYPQVYSLSKTTKMTKLQKSLGVPLFFVFLNILKTDFINNQRINNESIVSRN